MALPAGLADHLSGATTSRAGSAHREKPLLVTNLSASAASIAPDGQTAIGGTRPAATLAAFQARDSNLGPYPSGGFFQRNFNVIPEVGPAPGALPPVPGAKNIPKAKEIT